MLVALTLLPTLATAEVVRAHNNYKPVIVLVNTGPNVLTGCGEHGRVATLRLRIPPSQSDGNAWSGTHILLIQANNNYEKFEVRIPTATANDSYLSDWNSFNPENGRVALPKTIIRKGHQHTIEIRAKSGQNITFGDGYEMYLTLEKDSLNYRDKDKHEIYSPAMRLIALGGKGCQTLEQNPTCRGFWDWSGGSPTCLLE